jgi:hypothetical protein
MTLDPFFDDLVDETKIQHDLDALLTKIMSHTANAARLSATCRPYSMDNQKAKVEWAKAYAARHKIFKLLTIPDPDTYHKDI